MDDQPNVFEQMAAELNGHQITDERGQIPEAEEAPAETPAAQEEKTTEQQTPSAEKPAEPQNVPSQDATDDDADLGVDDSGKRYVPEKRFKDVYGKAKATERELEALKRQLEKGNALLQNAKDPKTPLPEPDRTVDKADILELKLTKSQFNPASSDYNRVLDEMAYKIFHAEPGISIMDAATKAEDYAREITSTMQGSRAEARLVKTQQADQGIAGKGGQRQETTPDLDSMSDQEMEAFLRKNNQW